MSALFNRSRRLLVMLALALGVSLAVTTALPASASSSDPAEQRRNYYGALSISSDNAWGGSYDYAHQAQGHQAVPGECKQR